MATHTINSDRTTQWKINQDNDTWTLGTNAELFVRGAEAILVDTGFDNNTINIKGDILNLGGQAMGVHSKADNTTFNIGSSSEIRGLAGIYSEGSHATIDNKGEIDTASAGIYASQSAHVENSGKIDSITAVLLNDESGVPGAKYHNLLVNHKGGEILGASVAVTFTGEGRQELVNDGLIIGGEGAVVVSAGTAHLINRGRIDGLVQFSDGNDYVDTRKGTINGEVRGQTGNDTYVVSKAHVDIVEGFGSGYDTVKSDANHKLGDNIEYLTLIGKADIDGRGNALDNTLRGNAGDNVLKGLGGADFLDGGKGVDFLTGGAGADVFEFHKGDGKDTITDFTHGTDGISLFNFTGDDNFTQIGNHMTDHGKDVWITYGSDTLVLKGVHEADLNAADFVL
jgi:Ca2+-binding RTX toxin-like protein